MSDRITIAKDDGLNWVYFDGMRVVGYASRTRAEAYATGLRDRLVGEGREAMYRFEPPADRTGVDQKRMRRAWLEGWIQGAR